MKLRLDRCARVELGNDKKEALSSSDMSLPEYNGECARCTRASGLGVISRCDSANRATH